MPRNMMDVEIMELHKRPPTNAYKDISYHHIGELCSNYCQNDYEDVLRGIPVRKRKRRNYERHCPSCHCPIERQRFSSPGRPRTSDLETMLNRNERISTQAINTLIKKSQSSPLSQKVCWHDCHTSGHTRCPKRLLQTHLQRRNEHDKYSSDVFRMKEDTVNSEIANEDIQAYLKHKQPIRFKKQNRSRESKGLLEQLEYSDTESESSMKYTQLRKPHVQNLESRRHYVGGDGEYLNEVRDESDVDCRQNECEYEDMRKLVGFEDFEKLKHNEMAVNKNDKRIEKRKFDITKETKAKKPGDIFSTTSKPSVLIKKSIDKPVKQLVFNGPAHLAKLDLQATKASILESIDHMLSAMDNMKNDAPQQEQTEQEIVEKFNALTIHRDSTDCNKRNVRLECLNHIRQQLDKLYALESILDNCLPKSQSLSNHDMLHNEEHQQSHQLLEQKIADS